MSNTRKDQINAILQKDSAPTLQWTREFCTALIGSSSIGIYIIQGGKFKLVSPEFRNICGYTDEELGNKDPQDLVYPDDRETVRRNAIHMLKGLSTTPYEFRIVTKTGEIRWIEERVISINYEGRRACLGNFLDVTRRRTAEEDLRNAEREVRFLFESVPDAVTISEFDTGKYIYVNEAFGRLTGFSREEALGKTPFDLGLYMDKAHRQHLVEHLTKHGRIDGYEIPFRMRDGRVLYGYLSGKLFRYKGKYCMIAVTKDVTPIKEAEKRIRESEQRYRELFNSVSDLIYKQDLEGRFVSVNRAMTEIFGYEGEEFLGRKASEFMKPELRALFESEYLEGLRKNGHYKGVTAYFTKDGRKIYLEYRSQLIRPEKGEPFISGIARDVTERILAQREIKKLEKQVLQAQKMEAIGTLAGGVAHDFNNILQAIFGYTQILLLSKSSDDPDVQNLKEIERAAKRASELTQQLLAFSRKVKSELKPVNLNQEVVQVEKLLRRTIPKMIDIELHLADDLMVINADPAQLEQVMMNLCLNARDAMPEGGKIIIETENVMLDKEYCKQHLGSKVGSYVLLSLSDTGHGMDKETLEHIFEPFFTTKEVGKGTGLGLAMVYGIVKSHGGYITCYSEPGQGTTFKIYLPVIEEEPQEWVSAKPEDTELFKGKGQTVLLVDDEETLRDLGTRILEEFGYKTIVAPNGESALEIYQANRDRIDLVILDLIMPGMGGRQCLKKILEINPEANVIIASGYAVNGKTKEALEAGAKGFVSKPYEVRQFLKTVHCALTS